MEKLYTVEYSISGTLYVSKPSTLVVAQAIAKEVEEYGVDPGTWAVINDTETGTAI
jgi:hypothetical protein